MSPAARPAALALAAAILAGACRPAGTETDGDRAPLRLRGDTALVIAVPGLAPENLAIDPATGDFLVGDVAGRRILRVRRDGRATAFTRDAAPGHVLGMKPDAARGLLWAATFERVDAGGAAGARPARSALVAYDLRTGGARARYAPPDDGRASHLFNDLVVSTDGDVYLTDTEASAVYRLAAGDSALALWYDGAPDGIASPNGIALDEGRRALFIAHDAGIAAIDLDTGRARPLAARAGEPLGGIDGLYLAGDVLLGIRNGGPAAPRVLAIRLDAAGRRIRDVAPLVERHPAFRIPTTGALAGDTLFFIANSQLDRLAPGGAVPDTVALDPIVVLRLLVPRAAPLRRP